MTRKIQKVGGMNKEIKKYFNRGLGDLVHLTGFQSSVLLIATIDMMFWETA